MGISVTCCVSDTSAFSISSNPLGPEFCLHFTGRKLRLGAGRGDLRVTQRVFAGWRREG